MATTDAGSSQHLLSLVSDALDRFEERGLDASLRSALRIARLRGDADEAWMFSRDLRPAGGSGTVSIEESQHLWPDDAPEIVQSRRSVLLEEWIAERTPHIQEALVGKFPADSLIGGSSEELAVRMTWLEKARDAESDPSGRLELESRLMMECEIVSRIRYRVFSYLCRCEREIGFDVTAFGVFDRYRRLVDAHLGEVAPDMLEQLNAAYRRASEGDSEARSHALTSCRRMLKSIADRVYPARDEPVIGADGKPHDLGDARFVSRLWQFVHEASQTRNASRRLTTAAVEELGTRIDRLNDLSSKGVHDDVTQEEVDLCVVHCFFVAGEILRLQAHRD